MTDQRQAFAVDALLRRLDVPAEPEDAFVRSSANALRQRAARAREEDRSPIRRLLRDIETAIGQLGARTTAQRTTVVGLIGLALLLAIAAFIAIVGASREPPLRNGPLVIEVNGALRAVDLDDGTARTISIGGDVPARVSRSPDGRQFAYWRTAAGGDQLVVIRADGTDRRQVAADLPITAAGGMAVWSPDSRRLAVEVEAGDHSRIVVVDVASGRGGFVTSPAFSAHWPLWSPEGDRIAFNQETDAGTDMAIVRADGIGASQVLRADLQGETVSGANSWSPDGAWIYFGTDNGIWRINVATSEASRITARRDTAAAPALSPDGTLLSFILSTPADWDLYVSNPDGSDPKRLLEYARNNSWSADGAWILSRWRPPGEPGGLVLVSATGAGYHVAVSEDESCPDRDKPCDLDWGQPKP